MKLRPDKPYAFLIEEAKCDTLQDHMLALYSRVKASNITKKLSKRRNKRVN